MKHPTLYHKGRKGSLHSWKIWTEGAEIVTEHGTVDGKKQISRKTAVPKNVGRANATTANEQAVLEATAMHKYKLDRKYSLTPEKAQDEVLLPMLAQDFEKRKKKDAVYPGDVQPKLDGVRCLARWGDKGVELVSRNGKPYNCPHIVKELETFLHKDTVLDGELYVHGVGFQTVSSWIKKLRPETSKVLYNIYDAPEVQGKDDMDWDHRSQVLVLLEAYAATLKLKHIRFVPTIRVKNEKEVYEHQIRFVQDGYEGAIFRNLDGLYQYGYRSNDLLKVKTFDDAEFEIVGYSEGIGKDKGTVIWKCKTRNGELFNCRPNGEYEKRKEKFENGHDYIGQMLKVKYFGMTDDNVPRFPIGLGFRLDEDV